MAAEFGYSKHAGASNARGQAAGNSVAVRGFGPIVRKAGAAARHMLRQAAAQRLGAAFEDARTANAVVYVGDEQVSYGELVAAAAALPVPETVALKAPEDFQLIGKPFKREETGPKMTGEAVFGIDVDLPDMLVAALAMPPQSGVRSRNPKAWKTRAHKTVLRPSHA